MHYLVYILRSQMLLVLQGMSVVLSFRIPLWLMLADIWSHLLMLDILEEWHITSSDAEVGFLQVGHLHTNCGCLINTSISGAHHHNDTWINRFRLSFGRGSLAREIFNYCLPVLEITHIKVSYSFRAVFGIFIYDCPCTIPIANNISN